MSQRTMPGDERVVGCAPARASCQDDRGRAHVRVPEPQEIRIGQLLHVRRPAFARDRVADAALQLGRARAAAVAARGERVEEVGEREDGHAVGDSRRGA